MVLLQEVDTGKEIAPKAEEEGVESSSSEAIGPAERPGSSTGINQTAAQDTGPFY